MNQIRKHALCLAAAMLLTGTAGHMQPMPQPAAQDQMLARLTEQLAALSVPAEPFAVLTCDDARQTFCCDGKAVGTEYAGFRLEDGALQISADALGIPSAEAYITPEEAAACTGCEITETDGGYRITAPFQSSRLIVRCSEVPAYTGSAETIAAEGDLHILQYDSPADAYAAYQQMQSDQAVTAVQPDRIYRAAAETASDRGRDVFHTDAVGVNEYLAWLKTQKASLPEITVAVLDTGLYAEHSWFAGRIAAGGVNMVTNESDGYDDAYGHGTHCAGIIAQCTPENVKILPIKVLSDRGYGSGAEIYCGMLYAMAHGADIVNLSLGGDGEDLLLDEAIRRLTDAGIPCTVAAGNEGDNAAYHHPAQNPACITVSAVDISQKAADEEYTCHPAFFTNYGACIDFSAPGVSIRSAATSGPYDTRLLSGTSMAAPFAAAACADLLSYNPKMKLSELYDCLKANAKDIGSEGFDEYFGWGLLNLSEFRFAAEIPPAPAIRQEQNPDGTVTVSLTCSDADAEIYYTLDGTAPDMQNGKLYTEPFSVSQSAAVAAVSCKNGVCSRTAGYRKPNTAEQNLPAYEVKNGVLLAYHGAQKTLDLAAAFPDGTLKEIGAGALIYAETETVILPDSVEKIGDSAFAESKLTSIIAKGVKEIGAKAFCDTDLAEAAFGAVESLGAKAFAYCTDLHTLECTDDTGLTVIPESCFQNCQALQEIPVQWEHVTEIGDSAFECSGLESDLKLTALQSFGKNAFRDSEISGAVLPEQCTVLPEGVFEDCDQMKSLSAPSVTVIKREALNRSGLRFSQCEIPFSDVTELGSQALGFFRIEKDITFTALEKCGAGALDYLCTADVQTVTLPNLKTASTGFFQHVNAILSLPALQKAEAGAFVSCPYGVTVGSELKKIADTAFQETAMLGGPSDSPLKAYAEAHKIPYVVTPGLFSMPENPQAVLQYHACRLKLRPYGAAHPEVKWYLVSGETETLLADAGGNSCHPDTQTAGTFCYRAVLYDGDVRIASADFPLEVQPVYEAVLAADGETAVVPRDAFIGRDTCFVLYQPAEQNDYNLTFMHHPADSVHYEVFDTDLAGEKNDIISSDACPETLRMSGDHVYLIRIFTEDTDAMLREPVVLWIRNAAAGMPHAIKSETLQFHLPVSAKLVYDPADQMPDPAAGYSITESGTDTPLVSGKDYQLSTAVQSPDTVLADVILLNGGVLDAPFTEQIPLYPLAGDAKIGSRTISVLPDCIRTAYRFTPDADGIYTFSLDILPALREKELQTGNYSPVFWKMPSVAVYGADDTLLAESDGTALMPKLKAGQTYTILLDCVQADQRYTLQISAGRNTQLLSSPEIITDMQETVLSETGKPQNPQCAFKNGSQILRKDVDYQLYYLSSQSAGLMGIAAIGIGDYAGCRVLTVPIAGTLTEKAAVTVPVRETSYPYRFTPETDGTYTFHAAFTGKADAEKGAVIIEIPDMKLKKVLLPDAFGKKTLSLTADCKAGVPCLVYLHSAGAGEMSLTVRQGKSCSEAEITLQDSFYTGDALPACSVTLPDGTVLKEDRDYVLSCAVQETKQEAVLTASGIGAYSGAVSVWLPAADDVQADTLTEITALPDTEISHCFRFVPETSGTYDFCTDNAEICTDRIQNSITVYDQNMEKLAGSQIEEGQYEGIRKLKLEAGKPCYITVETYLESPAADQGTERGTAEADHCAFVILHKKTLLRDARLMFSEYRSDKTDLADYTLTAPDGSILQEKTDYLAEILNPEQNCPDLRLKGTGNCIGYLYARFPDNWYNMTKCMPVNLNQPFAHCCMEGYSFILEQDTAVSLHNLSGEPVSASVQNLMENYGKELPAGEPCMLEMGFYTLNIQGNPKKETAEQDILMLHTGGYSLYTAEIQSADARFTGKPVTPHANVYLNGILLRENRDYVILSEQEMIGCGRYRLTIGGIGFFCGKRSFSFCILPDVTDDFPLLTETENSVQIDKAGTQSYFRWIPEKTAYCLQKDDNCPTFVTVYDKDGKTVGSLSGIGEQLCELEVTPQETYLIGVSFESPELTGTIGFSLKSDYRLLADCKAEMPERIPQKKEGAIPEYAVYDGNLLLEEGKDYTVFAVGGEHQLGTAMVMLRGIGRYTGTLALPYRIYPESPDALTEDENEIIDLTCGKIIAQMRGHAGMIQQYSLKADQSGSYALRLPDPETDGVCAFVYDSAGRLLDEAPEYALKENETLRIVCVTDALGTGFLSELMYCIGYTENNSLLKQNGITCRVQDGKAIVTDAERDSAGGILIPECFTDENGEEFAFAGIDAALRAEISRTHTIYCEADGAVAAYCQAHALSFALLGQADKAAGDLNGDGLLTADDTVILRRILSECSGMIWDASADYNGDGITDLQDLYALRAAIEK